MAHHSEHGAHEHHPHMTFKVYVNVLATLLFLTVITVVASLFDFGNWNLVVAVLIATVKAVIVGMFFMHLKFESPLIWMWVAIPIILLGVMVGGIFTDDPFRVDPKTMKYHMDLKAPVHAEVPDQRPGHH